MNKCESILFCSLEIRDLDFNICNCMSLPCHWSGTIGVGLFMYKEEIVMDTVHLFASCRSPLTTLKSFVHKAKKHGFPNWNLDNI